MANIYYIDARIEQILNLALESEEGLIPDEFIEELDRLGIARELAVKDIAKEVLNARATQVACVTELNRIGAVKNKAREKENRLLEVLNRVTGGEPQDFGFAKWAYRKSSAVIIDDEDRLEQFLKYEHPDCVTTKTDINKSKVKDLLKNNKVPSGYAHIEERRKGNLK